MNRVSELKSNLNRIDQKLRENLSPQQKSRLMKGKYRLKGRIAEAEFNLKGRVLKDE